ncbi:MAG: hypothetical protein ACPL4K_05305, partial [Candidatus Margulisiibacteriota bacterium]
VLGEDNPRELRVSSLENIIFAGTVERKPLSMAEVSLLFDNSSGRLPIAFTEVSIKRRTFREGESEFFINKNLCRLKDIKDLLLDTGLGEGTYSIITQGKVDALLSSKGEDRRAIFEEAAGINKYQTRKLAAEKKLIAAEQNILRLSDLKVEISEHLLVLEDQARKAKEYLEIQKKVRELEIGLCQKLLGGLLEKKAKLEAELKQAKARALEEEENKRKKEAELLGLKENLKKIEGEIEENLKKLDQEKDYLRDLELDRRFIEGEKQRELNRKEAIEIKRAEIEQKIKELTSPKNIAFGFENSFFADGFKKLLEQTKCLFEQLANLFSFLEKPLPFYLATPEEKEEAKKLKLELWMEEKKKLDEEWERLNFALEAYQQELETLNNKINTNLKNSLLEQIAQLKQNKEEIYQKITQLEAELRLQFSGVSSTSSLEIALAKIEGEMAGLQEKITLEYNLTLEEIQSQTYEISNLSKAKAEVEEGKRRLKELEPINLLAIEDFEKTKERLSFIEAQLSDLNTARENLQNLIKELDLRAEEIFSQTIQKISQTFSEIFSKLFVGGEAKISLVAGQPVLEAEIEISVRPSGRKWLPLPMLSGGERALSAIAILFSLLKIRPSPFCFLDEVDAAL